MCATNILLYIDFKVIYWNTKTIKVKTIFSKLCIASDHAGYRLKEKIKDFLIKNGVSTIDLGPFDNNSVDYPDYAKKGSKKGFVQKKWNGYFSMWFRHRNGYNGQQI